MVYEIVANASNGRKVKTSIDALTIENTITQTQAALMEDVASAVDSLACLIAVDLVARYQSDKDMLEAIDGLVQDRKREALRRKALYNGLVTLMTLIQAVEEERRRK